MPFHLDLIDFTVYSYEIGRNTFLPVLKSSKLVLQVVTELTRCLRLDLILWMFSIPLNEKQICE